ncbi:MAG: 50S ribosomal protein L18 [candidate division KSB1 bacterium]|nr:50S ribosomal protein L18 [candidate division KSB1 bacterium]
MAFRVFEKKRARAKRRKHIRKVIKGTAERPRLVVFRSNKSIYGQIIDDTSGTTLASSSSLSSGIKEKVDAAKNKVEQAKIVGSHIAEAAKEKKIDKVVFDRAGYRYHGRVKAFAEGARKGGLNF